MIVVGEDKRKTGYKPKTVTGMVDEAIRDAVTVFQKKVFYSDGEELRNIADAIQSLCAARANLGVIEDYDA